MAKVTIKMDYAEMNKLRKSPEIASVCEAAAQKLTQATGVEYKPDIYTGKSRINAAGYKKATAKDKKKICPKCGHSHPNCRCKV